MKWLALVALACLVCVASVAHASTGSPGPSQTRDSVANAERGPGSSAAQGHRVKAGTKRTPRGILDEPVNPQTITSPTVETIKSLTDGDSVVNPWFPGRGAIGVNVKVNW